MTQRNMSFLILALCGAAISAGLNPARAQSPAPGGGDVALRISAADNGGVKQVRIGDAFEVTLAENPSTGYQWTLRAPLDPALAVEGNSYVASAPGLIGSGGSAQLAVSRRQGGRRASCDRRQARLGAGAGREFRNHYRRQGEMTERKGA